jgi:hypothetical protein
VGWGAGGGDYGYAMVASSRQKSEVGMDSSKARQADSPAILTAFPPLFEYEKFVVEGSFKDPFFLILDKYVLNSHTDTTSMRREVSVRERVKQASDDIQRIAP